MRSSVAAALAALVTTSSYPVVAHVGGVPVRAPRQASAWGACPGGAVAIDPGETAAAKRAVLLALPTVARQVSPPLNVRGARVTGVTPASATGFVMPRRRSCLGTTFRRSLLVQVLLPAEKTEFALRANPFFYVARTPGAWVVWDKLR